MLIGGESMFGWWGAGWGWRRWMVAQAYGDPARAYFGLGPCGEMAYQIYKQGRTSIQAPAQAPVQAPADKEIIKAEIEALRKRIDELERLLKEST